MAFLTVDYYVSYVTHQSSDETYSYFQVKHCDDLGIPSDKSSTLFLFLGIFATLGRLGGGFLCNMRFVKVGLLQQSTTFIVGCSTMLMILGKTYAVMVLYVITFAFADGIMISSLIIEFIQSVEESKRASAFGLYLMFGGIVGITSPPLAGNLSLKIGCVLILLLSDPIQSNPSIHAPCFHPCIHVLCIHPCIHLLCIHPYIHESLHPRIPASPSLPPLLRCCPLLWSVGWFVVPFFCLSIRLSQCVRASTAPSVSIPSFTHQLIKLCYINYTLHFERKCARIFVCGHYLFCEGDSFPKK